MKKITKFMKIIVLLIIGISALSINNAVKAEENVVLTLQLDPDTSKAETDGEIHGILQKPRGKTGKHRGKSPYGRAE